MGGVIGYERARDSGWAGGRGGRGWVNVWIVCAAQARMEQSTNVIGGLVGLAGMGCSGISWIVSPPCISPLKASREQTQLETSKRWQHADKPMGVLAMIRHDVALPEWLLKG